MGLLVIEKKIPEELIIMFIKHLIRECKGEITSMVDHGSVWEVTVQGEGIPLGRVPFGMIASKVFDKIYVIEIWP
jgi:hypothetical protein